MNDNLKMFKMQLTKASTAKTGLAALTQHDHRMFYMLLGHLILGEMFGVSVGL